ncbi:MAG: hypothetical protein AABZ64_12920 [Nitrospinota bacterium]
MDVFVLFWLKFKEMLEAAVPLAAQAALVYLIVRFAFAMANLLLDLAESARPQPQPAANINSQGAPQLQAAQGQARGAIPERASS